LRALVVCSPGKARLDARLRETNLTRLEAKLTDLAAKLNRRPYTKYETVEKRLTTLLSRHPARPFLAVSLEDQEATLVLTWQRQEEAIALAAELDGRYLLVTNDLGLDAHTMLALSKRRDVPEKRFSTVKGPLQVRPVYVHKQERVLGLVFCTLVALLGLRPAGTGVQTGLGTAFRHGVVPGVRLTQRGSHLLP
jgi:transposase